MLLAKIDILVDQVRRLGGQAPSDKELEAMLLK
jgi:hypothetical protein